MERFEQLSSCQQLSSLWLGMGSFRSEQHSDYRFEPTSALCGGTS
jgi:hypothetical protein